MNLDSAFDAATQPIRPAACQLQSAGDIASGPDARHRRRHRGVDHHGAPIIDLDADLLETDAATRRRPSDRPEQLRNANRRAAVEPDADTTVAPSLHEFDLRADTDVDAVSRQRAGDDRRRVLFLGDEDATPHFHERDTSAEPSEGLRHLAPDRSCAEHDHLLGK